MAKESGKRRGKLKCRKPEEITTKTKEERLSLSEEGISGTLAAGICHW